MTRLRQAGDAGVTLYPSARPLGPRRRVRLGAARSEARPGRPALSRSLDPSGPHARAGVHAEPGLSGARARAPGEALTAWITEATTSGIAALTRFAEGLPEDLAAITAGLTLPWSNGPVEGQVNRLKLLKREGYGRASVRLLRQRLMTRR